jgi:hypothetical protein
MRRPGWFALRSMGLLGIAVVVGAPSVPAPSQAPARQCNLLSDTDPNSPDKKNPILTPIDASTKNAILTSGLPCAEVMTDQGPEATGVENRQRGFDFYSWRTFIALSAPFDKPKDVESSQPDTKTVWEDGNNFIPLLDVMLPGGAKPQWDPNNRPVPAACLALHALHPDRMVVKMIEESFNQPFKTGPLIDQRNNYAIFDILMNRVMFDYMVEHKLYSRTGQMSADNANLKIDFPSADNTADKVGAIMLKVSWKILTPEDDSSKFHHVNALVAMPIAADGQSDAPCLERTLGLVGIHIVHKTTSRPQWIWTSFEHKDNVPEQKDVDARDADPANNKLSSSYNFYDPSCPADKCAVNETPPRPWDPEPADQLQFRKSADGHMIFNSQITRVIPLSEANKRMNSQFQALLDSTVWKNYMLIGTQWPSSFPCSSDKVKDAIDPRTDFDKQPDMNCGPAPFFMANSTLETFSQGQIPQASSSCMACHGNATSYLRPKKPNDVYFSQSDFTFMLEKAR